MQTFPGLVAGFSAENIAYLIGFVVRIKVQANAILLAKDEKPNWFGIVVEGSLDATVGKAKVPKIQ
jgi:hypothetical protein